MVVQPCVNVRLILQIIPMTERLACTSESDSRASDAPAVGVATDVLSDVLRLVRLTGAVYFDFDLSSPWVAEAPASREIAAIVMPVLGACGAFCGDGRPPADAIPGNVAHAEGIAAVTRRRVGGGSGRCGRLRIGGRLQPCVQEAGRRVAGDLALRERGPRIQYLVKNWVLVRKPRSAVASFGRGVVNQTEAIHKRHT